MSQCLPTVYLARHGETAWNISGQHTGLTDLPLTERGERNARRLACPAGESPAQVGARADHILQEILPLKGDVLLFSSRHFLRVLAARWLGLEVVAGRYFLMSTASLSPLSYENNLSEPAIRLWDDSRLVSEQLCEAER